MVASAGNGCRYNTYDRRRHLLLATTPATANAFVPRCYCKRGRVVELILGFLLGVSIEYSDGHYRLHGASCFLLLRPVSVCMFTIPAWHQLPSFSHNHYIQQDVHRLFVFLHRGHICHGPIFERRCSKCSKSSRGRITGG